MEHESHTQRGSHTQHGSHAQHEGHVRHAGHAEHIPHAQAAQHSPHTDHERQTDHTDRASGHHQHATGKASWSTAARATLHCLTGCAIGEVLGMVIGTALGWDTVPTMALAIVLAFFFGYALTLRGVLKAGVDFRTAFRVALAADTLSIAVMELIDNGVLALWPGAMEAHLTDGFFWGALAFALLAAFVVTTPVNKWMIGRGKGHAVVHRYH
jgi:cation transport ATPase